MKQWKTIRTIENNNKIRINPFNTWEKYPIINRT